MREYRLVCVTEGCEIDEDEPKLVALATGPSSSLMDDLYDELPDDYISWLM